jgi:hypothetical protein
MPERRYGNAFGTAMAQVPARQRRRCRRKESVMHRNAGRKRLSRCAPLAIAAAVAALALACGAHANVYKCQDKSGGITYQEEPCAAGRELRNFDDDPPDLSVIHDAAARAPAAAAPPRDTRTLQGDKTIGKVNGDAAARKFVRAGMTEAEVLARIGRPDATSGASKSRQTRWSYLPAEGDPDTVTSITFSAGTVSEVSRKVVKR